jgi:hypothetical protein
MNNTGKVTVIIDDQIRDQQFTQSFDLQSTVSAVIGWLVHQYGLPRYNMGGHPIHYDLIRAQTGQALPPNITLHQAGVLDGEELQLVSQEARLLWKLIEKLKEELEDYIADQLEELAKKKLEEIRETLRKTQTKDPDVEQLTKKAAQLRRNPNVIRAIMGILILGFLAAVAVLAWYYFNQNINRPPQPPVEPTPEPGREGCWCEGPNLHCDDGRVIDDHPDCGGEVECWCEGPNLHCDDGRVIDNHPDCGGEVECWCEGPNLVCSDDRIEPDSPECTGQEEPPE